MVSVTSSSTASPDLVGGLAPVSQASLLKNLQDVAVLAQRFLGYQPDAAQVSKDVFRQALEQQFKGIDLDPDQIFIHADAAGASVRSLTSVMQDMLSSGRVTVDPPIHGFFRSSSAGGGARRVDMTAQAFVQVVLRHAQLLFGHYERALTRFWNSPGPFTGNLIARDAMLHFRRNQLAAEANLRRADNVIDPTQGIGEQGLALVLGVIGAAVAAPVVPVLYRLSVTVKDRDVGLAGAFAIAPEGGLGSVQPVLLYTPQRGLEAFSGYSALLDALGLRGANGDCDEILLNVPVADREAVAQLLKAGRGRWVTAQLLADAGGSLLGRVLDEQLVLQRANLYSAFLPFRAGILDRVPEVLALAGGLPADLVARPLRADTLPVVPPADLALGDQQIYLMEKLDALNALTANLLRAMPEFNGFFQRRLALMFPSLNTPIDPDGIYLTHYRVDETGRKQLVSSKALGSVLLALLASTEPGNEQDGAPLAWAFFREALTLNEEWQLPHVGSANDLAHAVKKTFAGEFQAFWSSIQAGQGPQRELLVRLRKSVMATLAALGSVDGTLQASSRAAIDSVLRYPTRAARALAFPAEPCPQVYRLSMADGTPLAGVFVVGPDSVSDATGSWVLYTQGEGFEVFSRLAELLAALTARLDAGAQPGRLLAASLPSAVVEQQAGMWAGQRELTVHAVSDDFVFEGVSELLAKQQRDLSAVLGSDKALDAQALAQAIDLAAQLDVAHAFMARNRQLERLNTPDWINALSAVDRGQLQALEEIAQEKNQLLGSLLEAIPTLGSYTKDKLRGKLREFLDDKRLYSVSQADIDPDTVNVVKSEWVRINYVPAPGLTPVQERTRTVVYSLTELALKNLTPWEKSLSWVSRDSLDATLTYADGRQVIDSEGQTVKLTREVLEQWVKALDIGQRYKKDVFQPAFDLSDSQGQARHLREVWLEAQAATLKHEAQQAALSPIAYRTPSTSDAGKKRGAQWLSAVLDTPDPARRAKVDGDTVGVSHLALGKLGVPPLEGGSQLVQGVFIVGVQGRAEMVLYASGAPDGRDIREILNQAQLRKLLVKPQWQQYLGKQLATNDPLVIKRVLPLPQRMVIRLVPCETPILPEMYRLMVARMSLHVERGAVSNAQLDRRSTINKVLFGIEVAGHLLDMMPWAEHWLSRTLTRWARLSKTAVRTFGTRGHNVPGLIVRDGAVGRILTVEMASGAAPKGTALGVKPLATQVLKSRQVTTASEFALHVSPSTRVSSFIPPAWEVSAVPALEAKTLIRGLEPNSRGIYRTSAGEYLIRPESAQGHSRVYRIKGDFKLYGREDLVVQVVDARSGIEVGALVRGYRGGWKPQALKGGGGASSSLSGLPDYEFLQTPAFHRREHQLAMLSSFERRFYQQWFNRDKSRFFKRLALPPRPTPVLIDSNTTVDELIEKVLKQSNGLVLGEAHNELASKLFLKEKMQVLKDHGVRTIYVEGLNAADTPLRRVRAASKEPVHQVMEAAQALDLKVRGLDDDLLTYHLNPKKGTGIVDLSKRLKEMNYFAFRQIERHYPKDGGKWVALVGAAHMNTTEGVAGLAELTGTLGVRIRTVGPDWPVGITIPKARGADGRLSDVRLNFASGMP